MKVDIVYRQNISNISDVFLTPRRFLKHFPFVTYFNYGVTSLMIRYVDEDNSYHFFHLDLTDYDILSCKVY